MKDRFSGQRNLVPTTGALPVSESPPIHRRAGFHNADTRNPSGQRQEARYCWQASSLANFAWNSRKVFGNDGRAIPYTTVVAC